MRARVIAGFLMELLTAHRTAASMMAHRLRICHVAGGFGSRFSGY